jgi:hypothetical protein
MQQAEDVSVCFLEELETEIGNTRADMEDTLAWVGGWGARRFHETTDAICHLLASHGTINFSPDSAPADCYVEECDGSAATGASIATSMRDENGSHLIPEVYGSECQLSNSRVSETRLAGSLGLDDAVDNAAGASASKPTYKSSVLHHGMVLESFEHSAPRSGVVGAAAVVSSALLPETTEADYNNAVVIACPPTARSLTNEALYPALPQRTHRERRGNKHGGRNVGASNNRTKMSMTSSTAPPAPVIGDV